MAQINGVYYSQCLVKPVHYTAILCNDNAQPTNGNPYYDHPVKNVYLLHGYSGSDTDWSANTPLGEYANMFNVNFFMPDGGNGFYLDREETGAQYAGYVGKEFVEYTRKTFGLSDKAEDTIIGGYSMGGFGALHTALMFNETFSVCIALSSALIVSGVKMMKPGEGNSVANYAYYRTVFGDPEKLDTSVNNPEFLIKELLKGKKKIPAIYQACGSEDFLIEPNREFKAFLDANNVPVQYFEGPGVHDFVFWRAQLKAGLEWALNR